MQNGMHYWLWLYEQGSENTKLAQKLFIAKLSVSFSVFFQKKFGLTPMMEGDID